MEYCLVENAFKKMCVWALQPGAFQVERAIDQLRHFIQYMIYCIIDYRLYIVLYAIL